MQILGYTCLASAILTYILASWTPIKHSDSDTLAFFQRSYKAFIVTGISAVLISQIIRYIEKISTHTFFIYLGEWSLYGCAIYNIAKIIFTFTLANVSVPSEIAITLVHTTRFFIFVGLAVIVRTIRNTSR